MLAVRRLFRFCTRLVRTQEQSSGIYRQKMRQLKDRYEIHTLTNIEFMCNLARTKKFQLTLNEYIILLYRLTQVFSILGKSTYYYTEFDELIYRVIMKFRDPDDYSCLGTFALTVARLGKYNSEHWISICDYVLQRKYDDQYDEVFALVVAFEHVGEQVHDDWVRERVVQLYRQLNEQLLMHIRQKKYNLKEMRKLTYCLNKYKFYEQDFWEEVGFWLRGYLRKLEQRPFESFFMVYEGQVERCLFDEKIRPTPILEELNEVAYHLSANGQPCLEFIQFTEKLVEFAIKQGSRLMRRCKQIEEEQQQQEKQQETMDQQREGQKTQQPNSTKQTKHHDPPNLDRPYRTVFVNGIELYHEQVLFLLYNMRRTMKEYKEYSMDTRVVSWLARLIPKEYNRYTIHELILLNESTEFLGYTNAFMLELILLKLQTLRDSVVAMNDLTNIFDLIGTQNLHIVQPIVLRFQQQSHPAVVLKFTQYMQQHLKYMPTYFAKLPAIVNNHHKYYSFDENCYFFYTLITNQVYWMGAETGTLEYIGEMEKLRQTIKVSAFSRGFKLTMDSYFHKVLQHVNLADFFEGGN